MILAKEQHTYTCGKDGRITRRAWRYRVQCDNPDCGEIFYRQRNKVMENQYCNKGCSYNHFAGVCDHLGCDQKYTHQSLISGLGTRLCAKHTRNINEKKYSKIKRKRNKAALYDRLGNRCACCGERDPMFLQVDHVFNDGAEHRRTHAGCSHPRQMLCYLEANPGSLQLLCCNCNHAKQRNGGEIYRPAKFTRRQLEIAA